MDIQSTVHFDGRLTASHVYALGQGAVITTPLLLDREQYLKFTLKPGDEIEVRSPKQAGDVVRCRILDIESVDTEPEHVLVRLTLEKAEKGE